MINSILAKGPESVLDIDTLITQSQGHAPTILEEVDWDPIKRTRLESDPQAFS